jgi:hypothetical protein
MAHKPLDSGQPAGKASKSGGSGRKRKATFVLPELLQAHLQSRQLISSMRLRPADACSAQPGRAAAAGSGTALAASRAAGGPAAASAACLVGGGRTYVPYRTLPLIFKQRRQHLQQQKSRARHTEPYQQRPGEGLLSLPEDVLLKVVCLLTHEELKPLFQVCKALRTTLHNAVAFHFNFSTPSRHIEETAPPALGERQKRPARTNAIQVMSRLSRGGRGAGAGRGSGGSARSAAPRALDFADTAPARPSAVVA